MVTSKAASPGGAGDLTRPVEPAVAPAVSARSRRAFPSSSRRLLVLGSAAVAAVLLAGGLLLMLAHFRHRTPDPGEGDTAFADGGETIGSKALPDNAPPPYKVDVPSLAPPPSFPAVPAAPEWAKGDREALDKLVKAYPGDQVSPFLELERLRTRTNDAPTGLQKEWLESAAAQLRPRAVAVLEHDFRAALQSQDLRACVLILAVAGKVDKGALSDQDRAAFATLKNLAIAGKARCNVWKVRNLAGSFLDGPYTEGGFNNRFTLTPKSGFRLLRVTVDATNISPSSDLPYAQWAVSDLKRALSPFDPDSASPATPKPTRLALDEFLFLVTPAGDWITCGHVCEGSPALRGMSITISTREGGGFMIFTGTNVAQGESFKAEILFSVPEGLSDLKFFILGSAPVPVKITKSGP